MESYRIVQVRVRVVCCRLLYSNHENRGVVGDLSALSSVLSADMLIEGRRGIAVQ